MTESLELNLLKVVFREIASSIPEKARQNQCPGTKRIYNSGHKSVRDAKNNGSDNLQQQKAEEWHCFSVFRPPGWLLLCIVTKELFLKAV